MSNPAFSSALNNSLAVVPFSRANILGDDRNPHCHTEGNWLFEALFRRDQFAEFIECFEIECQRLFGMRDGLFVGLTPRIAAFERWKIG